MLSTLAPKLIEPARWAIIFGIALTLAQTVLFFVSGPQAESEASAARPTAASQPQPRQPTSINAILSRNLFGVANQQAAQQKAAPAVETRLPLELRGVFVGERAESSAAIVAQKGKAGELYAIGDIVPGNAELVEVHADHVVLRRAGNLETLTFPEVTGALVASADGADLSSTGGPDFLATDDPDDVESFEEDGFAAGAPRPTEARGNRGGQMTPRDFVDSYRNKLDSDPESTLTELGIAPVSAGSSEGYRLGNLAKSPYLSQTGLQPGDVVLSVNGAPVGDIRQDRQQIDSILDQGSARLEVQRGTRRFFVTASLK